MIFYDSDGKENYFDLSYSIGSGHCGEAYHCVPDIVLKKYRDSCPDCYRLKEEVYDAIGEINSPNLYKINNIFYKNEASIKRRIIDAYTYTYLYRDDIDILTIPAEYLIYNLEQLSNVFTEFSNRGILSGDVKLSNTIIQRENIVLIDLDLFNKKSNLNSKKLNMINQLDVIHLFKAILMDCAFEYKHNFYPNFTDAIMEIFDNDSKSEGKILQLQRQFQKYKYPIDYVRKYAKNRF